MGSVSSTSGVGATQMMSLDGLDLESMLMAVQSNRVILLEQQIKDQMTKVQNNNNRISELNTNANDMNAVLAKVGTAATDTLDATQLAEFKAAAPKVVDAEKTYDYAKRAGLAEGLANNRGVLGTPEVSSLKNWMVGSGFVPSSAFLALPLLDVNRQSLSDGQNATLKSEAAAFSDYMKSNPPMKVDPATDKVTTRATAEAYMKKQQSEIDALGNTQQQDMLRLQSLSNKRNEAFEIMTNFMKKLADSRSGIIRNI